MEIDNNITNISDIEKSYIFNHLIEENKITIQYLLNNVWTRSKITFGGITKRERELLEKEQLDEIRTKGFLMGEFIYKKGLPVKFLSEKNIEFLNGYHKIYTDNTYPIIIPTDKEELNKI